MLEEQKSDALASAAREPLFCLPTFLSSHIMTSYCASITEHTTAKADYRRDCIESGYQLKTTEVRKIAACFNILEEVTDHILLSGNMLSTYLS
jgi:hypothetical protein